MRWSVGQPSADTPHHECIVPEVVSVVDVREVNAGFEAFMTKVIGSEDVVSGGPSRYKELTHLQV